MVLTFEVGLGFVGGAHGHGTLISEGFLDTTTPKSTDFKRSISGRIDVLKSYSHAHASFKATGHAS
jgi:hypothetical protein